MSEWRFVSVAVGDRVIIRAGGVYGGRHIAKVDRVTPTQIVVGHTRYRRDSGREHTSSLYSAASAQVGTPEAIAEVEAELRHKTLCRKMRDTNWERLSLAVLEKVAEALP